MSENYSLTQQDAILSAISSMLVKLDECNHNPPSTDYTLHIANLALAYQRLREADVTSGKK